MPYSSRRHFLQSSAFLLSGGLAGLSFGKKERVPLLSFSTLGCPDWTFDQIVAFAKQHGYKGIEVRGIMREMDLPKCKGFSPQNRKATMQKMKDNDLHFVDLGSSSTLHFPEGEERRKNIEEGKRFIDLAAEIECPFIRVFPNNFIKEQTKEATLELISKGLLELAEHANNSNVTVLIETHGDLVHPDDIVTVMQAARHKHTGIIWDATNMWVATGEAPADIYPKLKPYIRHTHIKDAKKENSDVHYKLLGEGEVPIFEAIDLLRKNGYKGYYSFEWEKLWHPEILEPDIAFADYPEKMKKHFA